MVHNSTAKSREKGLTVYPFSQRWRQIAEGRTRTHSLHVLGAPSLPPSAKPIAASDWFNRSRTRSAVALSHIPAWGTGAQPPGKDHLMKWILCKVPKAALLVFLVIMAGGGCFVRTKGRSANIGDKAPEFSLIDQHGEMVTLNGALEKGPAVIVFYRGNW